MKKVFIILLVSLLTFTFNSCQTKSCNKIPQNFSSYSDAIRIIKNSAFKFRDSINIANSQLMISAAYYSCDGKLGYFFYTRYTGDEYFYKAVPIKVWEEFKKADLKDFYYEHNIKDQYTSITILVDLDKK